MALSALLPCTKTWSKIRNLDHWRKQTKPKDYSQAYVSQRCQLSWKIRHPVARKKPEGFFGKGDSMTYFFWNWAKEKARWWNGNCSGWNQAKMQGLTQRYLRKHIHTQHVPTMMQIFSPPYRAKKVTLLGLGEEVRETDDFKKITALSGLLIKPSILVLHLDETHKHVWLPCTESDPWLVHLDQNCLLWPAIALQDLRHRVFHITIHLTTFS